MFEPTHSLDDIVPDARPAFEKPDRMENDMIKNARPYRHPAFTRIDREREEESADRAQRRGGAGRCNCENSDCPHEPGPCPNVATGEFRLQDIGSVCADCYQRMPEEYRENERNGLREVVIYPVTSGVAKRLMRLGRVAVGYPLNNGRWSLQGIPGKEDVGPFADGEKIRLIAKSKGGGKTYFAVDAEIVAGTPYRAVFTPEEYRENATVGDVLSAREMMRQEREQEREWDDLLSVLDPEMREYALDWKEAWILEGYRSRGADPQTVIGGDLPAPPDGSAELAAAVRGRVAAIYPPESVAFTPTTLSPGDPVDRRQPVIPEPGKLASGRHYWESGYVFVRYAKDGRSLIINIIGGDPEDEFHVGPMDVRRSKEEAHRSNARAFYVFEMSGTKPLRQVNTKPLTLAKAHRLAQNGKHDRAVTTDPRKDDFEIVERYKAEAR